MHAMSFTRMLMTVSALFLGLLGLVGSFAPEEILRAAGISPGSHLKVVVQVTGALYLGFAMLNWMVRDSRIGGIFNRPVVVGNLLHFGSGGIALLKGAASDPSGGRLWLPAIVYGLLAVAFTAVMVRPPKS